MIGHLKCCGKALCSAEPIEDLRHFIYEKNVGIDVIITGMQLVIALYSYLFFETYIVSLLFRF